MRALIERLILLARLDRAPAAAQSAPFDIGALVKRAVASAAPLVQKERVTVRDGVRNAVVFGDEAEIYEGIKNVIDNAIKYAPDAPVRVEVNDDDAYVAVSVSDAGPGMEPQDAAHAFDRFYRGANKYDVEGSGLGLAIAQRAAERAGGSITLRSAPGEGTYVVMRFPRLSGNSQPAAV